MSQDPRDLEEELYSLADLASSQLGVDSQLGHDELLTLYLAVQAHLSARGVASRWALIEVDELLRSWQCEHEPSDLWELVRTFIELLPFLAHTGILDAKVCRRLALETQAWLDLRAEDGEIAGGLAAHSHALWHPPARKQRTR